MPAEIKLGKLRRILQAAMGWTDSHLHQFIVGPTYYGVPHPGFPDNTRNERSVRLDQVAAEGIPGYEHLLEVLREPRHEEYEEMREWLPEGFDPEAFGLAESKNALRRVR